MRKTTEPPTAPTGGNWEASELGVISDQISAHGNFYVAGIIDPGEAQSHANMALISCAPEFLAACEAWEEARKDGGISHADLYEAAWKKTRNALSKYREVR